MHRVHLVQAAPAQQLDTQHGSINLMSLCPVLECCLMYGNYMASGMQ